MTIPLERGLLPENPHRTLHEVFPHKALQLDIRLFGDGLLIPSMPDVLSPPRPPQHQEREHNCALSCLFRYQFQLTHRLQTHNLSGCANRVLKLSSTCWVLPLVRVLISLRVLSPSPTSAQSFANPHLFFSDLFQHTVFLQDYAGLPSSQIYHLEPCHRLRLRQSYHRLAIFVDDCVVFRK